MANDLNQCHFIGRLGRDPEVRYMASGDACANFSIAVGQSWKDKSTGEKQEKVEWIRCVAWRQLGEICGEYLKKGAQVYVSGRMETRKWQDKDGAERSTVEIVLDKMQMLGGKRDSDGEPSEERQAPRQASKPGGESRTQGGFDDLVDDIPFVSCSPDNDYALRKLRII